MLTETLLPSLQRLIIKFTIKDFLNGSVLRPTANSTVLLGRPSQWRALPAPGQWL
jgi:hypothetical protein